MPQISLEQAKTMVSLYKARKESVLAPGTNLDILATSETFDLSDINAIISQSGCKAFRIYYGMSEDLNIHAILVGVDSESKDILSSKAVIMEQGTRCPPICPPPPGLTE